MSWEEFTEALEELYISIEEVAENLDLEVDEVRAWEESDDEIPDEAVEFIKSEREKRSSEPVETEE
jgi:DNA-binding transcriptional regulator YiaG